MLHTGLSISNLKDLTDFLNALAKEPFSDRLSTPDTKWKIVQISNITFYANSSKDAFLGVRVTFSDHIKNNHGPVNVSGNINLCFFLCLADSGRWWRCERDAQQLFNESCLHFDVECNAFTGVYLSDFGAFEDFSRSILLFVNWKEELPN